jgi:hypothetical protein
MSNFKIALVLKNVNRFISYCGFYGQFPGAGDWGQCPEIAAAIASCPYNIGPYRLL